EACAGSRSAPKRSDSTSGRSCSPNSWPTSLPRTPRRVTRSRGCSGRADLGPGRLGKPFDRGARPPGFERVPRPLVQHVGERVLGGGGCCAREAGAAETEPGRFAELVCAVVTVSG